MATQVRTEGERIANLEGQIAHLATKADISNLDAKIEALRAKLNTLMWIVTIAIPITGIVVGIVVQVLNNPPG
ncbi:MAG: hypothetical protein OXG78_08385 [Chloroflexi bacterium]|nr:hypothetical protein [Chloroflexota bacterium]